jgi:hypothetical protein
LKKFITDVGFETIFHRTNTLLHALCYLQTVSNTDNIYMGLCVIFKAVLCKTTESYTYLMESHGIPLNNPGKILMKIEKK